MNNEPEAENATEQHAITSRVSIPGDLTEVEAYQLLNRLRVQFGWAGTMFTREDAESCVPGEELTDEQWERLSSHRMWGRTLPETMIERGWDVVTEAIAIALPELHLEA